MLHAYFDTEYNFDKLLHNLVNTMIHLNTNQIKYIRSRLISNKQQILEALIYQKGHFRALPFEQRVSSYRRAHSNPRNQRSIDLAFNFLASFLRLSLVRH